VRPVTWPIVLVTGLGGLAFAAALAAPASSALRALFGSLLPRVASVAATGAAFGGAFTGVPEETESIDAIYTSDTLRYESPAAAQGVAAWFGVTLLLRSLGISAGYLGP
jgi:hypothetical protein